MAGDILWSILCPTMSRRQAKFLHLMDTLLPQAERDGRVEVVALHNDGERSLGDYRQALLEDARGEYTSFADDDDMVAADFVPAVTSLMAARLDVVAFTVEYTAPRIGPVPSYNSIVSECRDTGGAFWRDFTHVQPVRADLARKGDFRTGWPEDAAWGDTVKRHLVTEALTRRVLYYYRHDPADSVQFRLPPHAHQPRPQITSPAFRWHEWSTG